MDTEPQARVSPAGKSLILRRQRWKVIIEDGILKYGDFVCYGDWEKVAREAAHILERYIERNHPDHSNDRFITVDDLEPK